MGVLIQIIDWAIVAAALASAWFWWLASRQRVRRISLRETLDAADINRIVTALNRTQILNSRAALATAAAALLAAGRIALDALSLMGAIG
ncbi:hypothetical protein [Chthonobacter rhizosphaerae]|uniref:hypothetical protein n=1 Tax=Chthonobacter rhizosphaerae TaxID=2735553 RepID=UPI0015EEDD08|nr:hypothetical protein [Chthonobacter rhizosphaerae]